MRWHQVALASAQRLVRGWVTALAHLEKSVLALLVVLAAAGPVTIGAYIQARRPLQWQSDDWGAVTVSVWLGILLLALGWWINRGVNRRARAAADAQLIATTGDLHLAAARMVAGLDQSAQRIASASRAALQQLPFATRKLQKEVLVQIENAYSDIAFSTCARASTVPRAAWDDLMTGMRGTAEDALELATQARNTVVAEELRGLAKHVTFVASLGTAVRRASSATATKQTRRLIPQGTASASEFIARLSCLYRRELAVVHEWAVLASGEGFSCAVELVPVLATAEWLTPWYLKRDAHGYRLRGNLTPVSVVNRPLNEAAQQDWVQYRPAIPLYPHPLRHGGLPSGVRNSRISDMMRLLTDQPASAVAVLAYELRMPDGSTKRLVIDGNHRLAAARRLVEQRVDRRTARRRPPAEPQVLTFLIKEAQPIRVPASRPGWSWEGFTADLMLIRDGRPPTYNGTGTTRGAVTGPPGWREAFGFDWVDESTPA